MYRIARLILLAVVCILMAVVPVLVIIFWPVIGEWVGAPRRRGPQPGLVVRKPAPPVQVRPELPPGPPRKGRRTWRAVEAEFEQMRARRDEHPGWRDNPARTYEIVSNPAFTDSDNWLDHCVALSQWRREIPDSPTPLIAMARAQVNWAWEARGYGLTESVRDEDWRLFYSRIAEARELLQEALMIGVKDGEAHRLLIQVGMGEGRPYEEVREVLDAGRKFDPTYFQMYTQFARYLLPRWHGVRGDVERFAVEVVEMLPGDDGLEAYARIAAAIHQTDSERELIYFGEYDKDLLVKASKVLMERRDGARWETNFAALCAWVARDRKAALALADKIGDEIEGDPIWVSPQHRREFEFWCKHDEFGEAENGNWFWGSMAFGENVVFEKDSKSAWCAQGYGPAAMNLFDIESGYIRLSLPSLAPAVNCFAVDQNKGWVAAGLTGGSYMGRGFYVRVWRIDDPEHPWTFETEEACRNMMIHPTKPQVVWLVWGQSGYLVKTVDVESGERRTLFKAPNGTRRLGFSADGKWIAAGGEFETIWDSETGEMRCEMPNSRMKPRPKQWCEKVLQIDAEGRIWALVEQIETGKVTLGVGRYGPDAKSLELIYLEEELRCSIPERAMLSDDCRLLAVNGGERATAIEVWNVQTGKRIGRFGGYYNELSSGSFSPDGKWLATMGFPTGLVRIWPVEGEGN